MPTLYYDTETTGLPDWRAPSEAPHQPHITQIAAIILDEDGVEIGCVNTLIKPDGWTIPDDVAELTGITTGRAEAEGIPIADAVDLFLILATNAELRIAHNEPFDARMMRIELMRLELAGHLPVGTADEFKAGATFCTMRAAQPIVNLPPTEKMLRAGFNNPKQPKLIEAHQFFFGEGFDGAHNALNDVRACIRVHWAILAHQKKGEAA